MFVVLIVDSFKKTQPSDLPTADFVSCLANMAVAAAEAAGVDRKSGQWGLFVERHTSPTRREIDEAGG